jgi:hypothetical protein
MEVGRKHGTEVPRVGEDYQALVDEISGSLGTPATLEDRDFTLIAFGAHEGGEGSPDADLDPVRTRSILQRRSTAAVRAWFESFGITRAREPVRIPPDPAAGVRTGRLCLPVRHGGVVYGYVWLLDDGALDLHDPRVARAQQTATRIGALLAAQAQAGAHAGELLRELLVGPAAARGEVVQELRATLGAALTGPLALVAALPWPVTPAGATGSEGAAGLPGAAAHTVLTDRCDAGSGTAPGTPALAVLVRLGGSGTRTQAHTVARRLLGSSPGAPPRAAGIGALNGEPAESAATAWREARIAAGAAAAEPERFGPVAEWEAVGPYRLLGRLPVDLAADQAVRTLLEPAHREMARTAEAFLDRAGQAGRTAADLGVHRQTLYYRLQRVERLTGLDLDEGADRLLLHMALKTARLG